MRENNWLDYLYARQADALEHSAKGTTWANHKYIKKIGNRYIYKADQLRTKLLGSNGSNANAFEDRGGRGRAAAASTRSKHQNADYTEGGRQLFDKKTAIKKGIADGAIYSERKAASNKPRVNPSASYAYDKKIVKTAPKKQVEKVSSAASKAIQKGKEILDVLLYKPKYRR